MGSFGRITLNMKEYPPGGVHDTGSYMSDEPSGTEPIGSGGGNLTG